MHRKRISQATIERCLLTEVAPYEAPVLYSNWGAYNYQRVLKQKAPGFLKMLFNGKNGEVAVPFKYKIRKEAESNRTLFVLHPKNCEAIIKLYEEYSYHIIKLCRRSSSSLRYPAKVARFFTMGRGREGVSKLVEEVTAESAYASSFFAYEKHSHVHKFFESDDYAELEKRYAYMMHVDITKCFPSIYTHSISWAVRGKRFAKARLSRKSKTPMSFDEVFDRLMQDANYKETHGIPIGPELSRIFAEIILQKVDVDVEKHLKEKGIEENVNYRAFRYIDDYYFFYNDERARESWETALKAELEKYRLYLGSDKVERVGRPFITEISMLKISLSVYLKELGERLNELTVKNSQQEINRIRSIVKGHQVPISKVSSYTLATLERLLWRVSSKADNLADQLYIILELACHILRMDIRVACCFKWMSIVLTLDKRLVHVAAHERQRLRDKLYHEWKSALHDAFVLGASVEGCNLLITGVALYGREALEPEVLEHAYKQCNEFHGDEYSKTKRLNYFEIVTLIYAIADNPNVKGLRDRIVGEATDMLRAYAPSIYSEMAHLFLDLMSCPWVTRPEKRDIVVKACSASEFVIQAPEVERVIDFAGKQMWFFNWSRADRLKQHLKKKRLMLAY